MASVGVAVGVAVEVVVVVGVGVVVVVGVVVGMTSFDADAHKYTDGDRELVSVTTLLTAVGVAKNLKFLDPVYRLRGTAVHQILELIDRHDDYSDEGTHESLRPYAQQIMRWKEDTGFKGRVWELPMFSRRLGVAGTLDVGGDWQDEIHLVDAKTGVLIPVAVGCQLALYEHLLIHGEVIEMVKRDGEFVKVDYDEEWIKYARANVCKIRRKSLNLKPENYTQRSHDEPYWRQNALACVTMYRMFEQFGLKGERG